MAHEYNGGLTREQFLFYEIRVVSSLLVNGYSRDEALTKIKDENLFQFPTERSATEYLPLCMFVIE